MLALEVERRADGATALRLGSRQVPPGDLALGLRVLATLVDSGLPMRRVATTFATLAPASWRSVTVQLDEALRNGRPLSAAFDDASVALPPVVIGILRAGEAGSGLAPALRAAADLAERQAETRAAIRSALAYPMVLAAAGVVSMGILVGVVLPRFATILGDLGQALPPTTRFVLATAGLLRSGAVPGLLAVGVLLALFLAVTAGDAGRTEWHSLLLRAPLIGPIRKSAATARACAALGALLASGVSMPAALTHAATASGDSAIAARIRAARAAVIGGRTLGGALDDLNALTPSAVRLVRAGEESGRLSELLGYAGRLESEGAATQVRRLVRLLEPTLILLFAGAVALVAAALLQAVYSVHPS